MKRAGLFMLLAALAWGCGGGVSSEGDTDEDTQVDGEDTTADIDEDAPDTAGDPSVDSTGDPTGDTVVDVPTDGTGCTHGELRCNSDDTALEECVDGAWVVTDCYFGCAATPEPHCLEWDISNVDDDSLLTLGEPYSGDPWPSDSDSRYEMRMDTDTGQIDIYVWVGDDWAHELEMRPADRGLNPETGIGFTVVDQGTDEPELGVFSFQQFDVPANYVVRAWGSRPLVILSEDSSTIDGGVSAGCNWETGDAYGGANYSDEGAGAGTAGDSLSVGGGSYRDGGGGGAAFCGAGGTGGGYEVSLRGVGGTSYGTEEMIPLIAGSGGGRGGGSGGGRWGGRSGGAVQLVSGDTLTITGWVDAGGCGGRVADWRSPEGGGGGGSGGGVLLEAPALVITGAVTANGGGGAGGGRGSDSDDGEDGHIAETTAALGGVATAGSACDGADGNDSTSADGLDAPTCDGDTGLYNAGGGGAGGGRIRLNGMALILTGSLSSPDASTGCVTEADLVLF